MIAMNNMDSNNQPDNNQPSLVVLDNQMLDLRLNDVPSLFNKKSHPRLSKPLAYMKIDAGIPRHFTPAAQEWFNSIYAYDKNYIKSLPSADKSLMDLLNTYFNSILEPKLYAKKLKAKPTRKQKRRFKRLRPIKVTPIKIRRVSTKRVFVGKGELKHTAKKVILTFYLYSTEGMVLSHTYNALTQGLIHPWNKLKETITKSRLGKKITTYNRVFSLSEFLVLRNHIYWYLKLLISLATRLNKTLIKVNIYNGDIKSLVEIDVLTCDEQYTMSNTKVSTLSVLSYPDYSVYLYKIEENYKREWYKYIYLLNTYKLKFTNYYISKLNRLVNDIYKKNVVFNIVNLKKMHLNSDIFTQAVALKLRNKANNIYRVLKSSLRKIKIKAISHLKERQKAKRDLNLHLVNKVRNNDISSMLSDTSTSSASGLLLDLVQPPYDLSNKSKAAEKTQLLDLNPWSYNLLTFVSYEYQHLVFSRLKHILLRGIRVEAKGRLTRRATASRSVFKMRLIGGLKNIESSIRGWSAIMLRGIYKCNVQYSVISSNNSNGAYGVKGWVGNK